MQNLSRAACRHPSVSTSRDGSGPRARRGWLSLAESAHGPPEHRSRACRLTLWARKHETDSGGLTDRSVGCIT